MIHTIESTPTANTRPTTPRWLRVPAEAVVVGGCVGNGAVDGAGVGCAVGTVGAVGAVGDPVVGDAEVGDNEGAVGEVEGGSEVGAVDVVVFCDVSVQPPPVW